MSDDSNYVGRFQWDCHYNFLNSQPPVLLGMTVACGITYTN